MKESLHMRSHTGSIVESPLEMKRPVFVMQQTQIISQVKSQDESIDFLSTDVIEDLSSDDKQNQIISLGESIDFLNADVMKDSSLGDKLFTDSMDLISTLPQPILHHMLGFLLAQESAVVAVLSKTWYQVWKTLPFIDFDGPMWGFQDEEMKPWLPYVDSILSLRKNQGVNIDKFRIGNSLREDFKSYLDHWITTLGDLNVRDLCFRNYGKRDGCRYCTLPEIILSVKSITSLELLGFRLDSFQGMGNVNWPLLRKLHLTSMLLSDDVIHNIISNCRAIEDLNLESCVGLKVIKISSLVKLQKFVLRPYNDFPKVEIDIPSLQSFSYFAAEVNHCFNIASCKRLRTLKFSGQSITQDWFDKLFSIFPLLESLTMGKCYKLIKINISSCKLKYFNLDDSMNLVEANINTPNLSTFVYFGTGALSWSLNASPQLQVNVILRPLDYSKCPGGCAKVTNFLRTIGDFEVVKLGCRQQSLSFSKEIKDELIYSQCDLKNLLLDFPWPADELTIYDATRLLDNLLWIYSQVENLSIYVGRHQLHAIELLYKRLTGGEERLDCCDSVPIKCWRHFLNEVKFETVDSDEARRKAIYDKEKVLKFNFKQRE